MPDSRSRVRNGGNIAEAVLDYDSDKDFDIDDDSSVTMSIMSGESLMFGMKSRGNSKWRKRRKRKAKEKTKSTTGGVCFDIYYITIYLYTIY